LISTGVVPLEKCSPEGRRRKTVAYSTLARTCRTAPSHSRSNNPWREPYRLRVAVWSGVRPLIDTRR
jgi:hypothetical protein